MDVGTVGEKLCWFENNGYVSISLVGSLEKLSVRENNVISILQTLVENNKQNIKKKIVNTTTDTKFNLKANNKDTYRKAFSIKFNSDLDDVNTTLADDILRSIWNDIVLMGIVDPNSKPVNGDGEWGVDLLDKDYGCGLQLKHYDFPQFNNGIDFKSFRDTFTDTKKYEAYNSARDGGISVFINPFCHSDYLHKGDGSFIEIPPYSYLVLRGNVIHSGTGNVSQFEGIYKIFFYGDPPSYNRKGSENQYRVFLPAGHEYHSVIRDTQNDEVVKIVILPAYTCLCCGNLARYTHPYCKHCLQSIWSLQIVCRNNLIATNYVGHKLFKGYVFPQKLWGDVVTSSMYRKIHSELQGEFVMALQLCDDNTGDFIDLYIDCLYKRSFIATFQKTSVKSTANIQLLFNQQKRTVHLVCLSDITAPCRLVLYTNIGHFNNTLYSVDLEEYAVINAKAV